MNGIFLLMGSNLGNRLKNLKTALNLLSENCIFIKEHSSVYETAPWGIMDQPYFFNVVLLISTPHNAEKLLQRCLQVEETMDRLRKTKWGERNIDIDILYYHDMTFSEKNLQIPHPGIPNRRFTLLPLVELCPNERHPILRETQSELLARCTDELDCRPTKFKLN